MSKHIYDIFEPRKPKDEYKDFLIVDWAVGSMCNFSCTYCDPLFYEGKTPWHDIDDCTRFIDFLWENVCIPQNKILYFNIHAGEPTLWRDLDRFCEHVKSLSNNNQIRLLTNGTRNVKWWTKRNHLINSIIVSVHHGQSKNEEISEKFDAVYDSGIDVSLHLMVDVNAFDTCIETYKYLYNNCKGPQLQFKPLRTTIIKAELQNYTEQQLSIMQDLPQKKHGGNRHQSQNPMQWRKIGEEPVRVHSIEKELLLTHLNNWNGWYCNMGIETIVVQHQGHIKPGSNCFKWLKYGNIKDKEYSVPLLPVLCKLDYCGCLTDLQTTKVKDIAVGEKYIDAPLFEQTYEIATRN
tara:strand:+ start:191 stop:1237 length:1047 start_codon:yes stop_codon:yes gene_type:complete